LVLDYPGTNKVASVRFGDLPPVATPVVDATTCPEYVSGIGALEIVPVGLWINFR
jgi:hypothetical protein